MDDKFYPPIHPGGILMEEFLEPRGITQHKLAVSNGVPPRRINGIVHGKRRITADTALHLGRFFGMAAQFWINLQSHYDLDVESEAIADQLELIKLHQVA
ncbi:hypothetical protein CRES_1503 [Corynebacterium resistens DSM 45100]|uniref:HTH cro/C1-type domain-containing protein n=1 Tax=Corynebacterium resistens (strain DSM 45100 / JCM 12819 / GTC 2026 / SICGH 158) TaxID=662755 RepID=F8DZU3_CORRG|nr:HigA family addiction module antitoxin [Corynebacterium resistens]AEI09857.1 hypothetical protein CRES_1503 [Corynebacterium resistens DSM 45100]